MKILRNFFKDTLFVIDLLYNCLIGKFNFASYCMSLAFQGLFESFDEHVGPSLDGPSNDEVTMALVSWIDNFFPPKMVKEGILDKLKELGPIKLGNYW